MIDQTCLPLLSESEGVNRIRPDEIAIYVATSVRRWWDRKVIEWVGNGYHAATDGLRDVVERELTVALCRAGLEKSLRDASAPEPQP